MNRLSKLMWLGGVAALAASTGLPSCGGKDEDAGLIAVSVTAPVALPEVASMQVRVGGITRTFSVAGKLSPNPIVVGIYSPTSLTGRQRVSVEAPPSGCPRWAGEAEVDAPAAGLTSNVSVSLSSVPCSNADGGVGGTGGAAQGGAGGSAGGGGQGGAAQGGAGGAAAGGAGGAAAGGAGGAAAGGAGGATGMGGAAGAAGVGGAAGAVPADPPSLASCTEVDHIEGTCMRQGAGDWAVRSVAFAPDGSLVASGGEDGRIKLWKPMGKTLVAAGKEWTVQGDVKALAFAPDGSLLFAGHGNGGLRAYRIPAGTLYGEFAGHAGDLYVAAVSPDSAHLVSGDSERRLKVWTVANRTEVKTFTLPSNAWALAIAPKQSPGTLWAAIGLGDGGIVLRDLLASGTTIAVAFSRGDSVNALAFSPDGNTLAVGSDDGLTDLYDVANRAAPTKKTPQLLSTYPQSASGIMYAPDGRHLAVATASLTGGGAVRLFSVTPQMPIADKIPTYIPMSLAFAPDGRAVVAGQYACGKILYCRD